MISNSDRRRPLPVKSGIGSEPAIGFDPSVAAISGTHHAIGGYPFSWW